MLADCTAIILAGGGSQRMGQDKANLMLGEQTLLQHVMDAMRQVFPHIIVSVRQPRPDIELIQVCDAQDNEGLARGAGPLAGIAACLSQVQTPWAFVVACDMPFVQPDMIELLSQHRDGDHQAVVPVVQGHPQPLAAFYARSVLNTMRAQLAGLERKSIRAVLEQLQVRYVDETELSQADPTLCSFFDLDTPQDVLIATQEHPSN